MATKQKARNREFVYEHLELYAKLTHENCNFELTKEQFTTIRSWIRENEQHDHNIPLPVFNSIKEAKEWCKLVVKAERKQGMDKENYDFICTQLEENLK